VRIVNYTIIVFGVSRYLGCIWCSQHSGWLAYSCFSLCWDI